VYELKLYFWETKHVKHEETQAIYYSQETIGL
jgi:hypothetical protein